MEQEIGGLMLLILMILTGAIAYWMQKVIFRKNYAKGVGVKIEFQTKYIEEGGSAFVTEVIENRKYLPLPVVHVSFQTGNGIQFETMENINVTDNTSRRDVFSLLWNQRITRKLKFFGAKRGYYTVKTADVTVYDFLMTDKYYLELPQSTEIYVYPKQISCRRLNLLMQRIWGMMQSNEKLYEDPLRFAGIREYNITDDMKRINWKASAKGQQLMVNVYDSCVASNVYIFLDVSDKGIWKQEELAEEGIRLTSSLYEKIVKLGSKVTVYTNGSMGKQEPQITVSESSGGIHGVNRMLANIQLQKSTAEVEAMFQQAQKEIGKNSGVFLLISKNQKEGYGELLRFYADKISDSKGKIGCMWLIPYHKNITGEETVVPKTEGVQQILWEAEL